MLEECLVVGPGRVSSIAESSSSVIYLSKSCFRLRYDDLSVDYGPDVTMRNHDS